MRRPEEVRIALMTLGFVLVFAMLHTCQAKRGCSAFGHSCFGGHGKRMDSSVSSPEEVAYDQQASLQDVVFTAPRSVSVNDAAAPPPLALLQAAVELQRQRQRQNNENDGRMQRPGPDGVYNLTPLLRQWLQAYRNSQDLRPQTNM